MEPEGCLNEAMKRRDQVIVATDVFKLMRHDGCNVCIIQPLRKTSRPNENRPHDAEDTGLHGSGGGYDWDRLVYSHSGFCLAQCIYFTAFVQDCGFVHEAAGDAPLPRPSDEHHKAAAKPD